MRKERNKGLAIILSLAMVIGMMPGWVETVKAAEPQDYAFEEGTFDTDEENGVNVYRVNKDSEIKVFKNITIPNNHIFEISGAEVTAESITIETGGQLVVMDYFDEGNDTTYVGRLTVPTVTAAVGAHLFLGNKDNKPSCVVNLYDIKEKMEDPSKDAIDITDDGAWGWFDFIYYDGEPITGWGVIPNDGPGPGDDGEYAIFIDGFESGDVELSYCISTDGETYEEYISVEDPISMDEGGFETKFNVIPEDLAEGKSVKNVKIKVAIKDGSNKKIYYAYRGAGWSDVHADELSADGQHYGVMSYEVEFDHTLDFEASGFVWHEVHVALNNYRQGTQETADLISNYLYAYGDLNDDTTVDETDMKIGLATELSSRFFWYAGGIVDGGTFDIYKPQDLYDPTNEGASRIDVLSAGTITAKNNSGANVSVDRYTYRISLGVTEDGTQVSTSGDVYALPTGYDLLIWTGSEWFVRNSTADITKFYEDTSDPTKNDSAICVKANFNPAEIKIGGNGCTEGAESINPDGDDVYCTYLMNKMYEDGYEPEEGDPNYGSGRFIDYYKKFYTSYRVPTEITGKLRLVNPGKTYVVVNSEGERKAVYGINSEQVDRIAQTGSSAEKKSTDVFVGASAIHIEKVGDDISGLHISNVALKDTSMSDGVVITKEAEDDFKVKFKSNFYDTVPLIITYGDDSVKELTINRVGLVIKTQYLIDQSEDQGPGPYTDHFYHGKEKSDTASYSYDYHHGQTIIVYATYYHPTTDPTGGSDDMKLYVTNADGTTRIIDKAVHTFASSDSVAMTDFIIAFRCGSEKLGENADGTWVYGAKIDPSMQAMSAIVLNAGYDDATIFSGTQVGAGKGVYWDGHIEWNY